MTILLSNLMIYRNLCNDDIINNYINLYNKLQKNEFYESFNKVYYGICSFLIYNGYNSINDYIFKKIMKDENIFSLSCEKGIKINLMIKKAAMHDIAILKDLSRLSLSLKEISQAALDNNHFIGYGNTERLTNIFNKEVEDIYNYLFEEYTASGCGEYRDNYAFSINDEGSLFPVYDFNPVVMENIFGYERQKNRVIENTKKFVSGRSALNTLLVGDSGTGKSTTVKALIPMFKDMKLRMIEADKSKLNYIPDILRKLRERGMYFIIFIDDLSFDTNEDGYKYLKSVVEGSIHEQPDNVLFYITSNRKHLIRENFLERENEVHVRDAINEQTSLSDRFGLTVIYYEADQEEYFNIVLGLADEHCLTYDEEHLLAEAKKFAFKNGGRTGRTATQFIKSLS